MIGKVPGSQGAGWAEAHRRRAIRYAALNPAVLGEWAWSFPRGAFGYDTSTIAGTGAATFLASPGGSVQITTGGTANSDQMLSNVDFQVGNAKTSKWYVAARAKITTTTDAQAQIDVVGVMNGGTPTAYCALTVVNGVLNLRLRNGAGPTDVATSWTVDTTAAHDFAISFDGTTIRAFVDGVQVASQATLTDLTTGTGYWGARVRNGTTAAVRTLVVYEAYYGLEAG